MSTPKNGETNRAPAGVILVNHAGTPIYLNTEALAILSYRGQLKHCRSTWRIFCRLKFDQCCFLRFRQMARLASLG
jgi:hypothetical protein